MPLLPMIRRAFFPMALVATAGAAQAQPPGGFQAYVEDDRYDIHHAPEALARFDALMMAAGELASLPDDMLSRLAADAAIANFYYGGTRVDAHAAVFAELARRKSASALEIEDMHRSLIAARRWRDAIAFAEGHPQLALEALPTHIVPGDGETAGPHYWRFDPEQDRLTREPLVAAEGITLVVVSSPGCAFSRAAIAALESDPALDQVLPERRVFVAPAIARLELAPLGKWNAAHPRFRHVLVDRPLAWTFVRKWNTPQFLFLRDGEVVAEVEGWPESGQAEALLAASRSLAAR
jgi:hypothetical protein